MQIISVGSNRISFVFCNGFTIQCTGLLSLIKYLGVHWNRRRNKSCKIAIGWHEHDDAGVKVRECRDCRCNRQQVCQRQISDDEARHTANLLDVFFSDARTGHCSRRRKPRGEGERGTGACSYSNFTGAMPPVIGGLVTTLRLEGLKFFKK